MSLELTKDIVAFLLSLAGFNLVGRGEEASPQKFDQLQQTSKWKNLLSDNSLGFNFFQMSMLGMLPPQNLYPR